MPLHNAPSFDESLLETSLLSVKTFEELFALEHDIVSDQILAFKLSPFDGKLDYAYLKSIHHHLFSDIYTWAGKDRHEMELEEIFRKGATLFTPTKKIPQIADRLFEALEKENFFLGILF